MTTTLPAINLNGSDPASLLSDYVLAVQAINTAMETLSKVDVHGRDYQTIRNPANAGLLAREEMAERIRKLSTIKYELELVAHSIERQMSARTPQPAA